VVQEATRGHLEIAGHKALARGKTGPVIEGFREPPAVELPQAQVGAATLVPPEPSLFQTEEVAVAGRERLPMGYIIVASQ
jgi:hypothetical protein